MYLRNSGRIQHPAERQGRGVAEFTFGTGGDDIQQLYSRILFAGLVFARLAKIGEQVQIGRAHV